jgi:lipopolysaccharide exporter
MYLIHQLRSNSFIRNVMILTTGTTVAQVLPIVISPILTRIYTPREFGILSVFVSISSICSVIATLRYEFAIMLPDKGKDAINITALAILIASIFSVFLLIVVIFFKQPIGKLISSGDESNWLYWIPFFVFFSGIYQTLSYWFNRTRRYRNIADSKVIQSAGSSSSNVIFGYLWPGYIGLIFAVLLGQVLSVLFLIKKYLQLDNKNTPFIKYDYIKNMAREYSDFPKKSAVAALFNILAGQFPFILIGVLFNPYILGLYSLTMRVLNTPMTVLGSSISQVYYDRAINANKDGTLSSLIKKTTLILFLIIAPPLTILFLFGEQLFTYIFGHQWGEAGTLATMLIPFFILRFIFVCQSSIISIKRKLNFEIKFNVFYLISQVVPIYIGYYFFNSFHISVLLMSISGFLVYLMNIIWILKIK